MENFDLLDMKPAGKQKPKNLAAHAIYIAIRDAEIHGTTLAIKTNGKIEELTPKHAGAAEKRVSKKKTAKKKA